MKKLLALLLALVMVLSFAACATEEEPTPSESESETENTPVDEEPATEAATYKLGMGISTSTASSKDGLAQADVTVAVVVTDAEGKIVSVQLDCAQTKVDVTDGVMQDLTAVNLLSKQELKEDYNMLKYSAEGTCMAEWYVQADAFEAAVVGMTGEEVAAIETVLNESGHNVATDETLLAACTMDIVAFKNAIAKACADEYAKEFTADTFTLGLGVNTAVNESTAATAEADGTATLYTNFAGVALDAEGKVLVALVDMVQVKVGFNASGAMTNAADYDANFKSKKELKDDYNMLKYSAEGTCIAEWYTQALAYETYVVGMTGADVAAIETTTNDHGYTVAADETLYAGCTIQVVEFIASVSEACGNVK